MVKLSCKIAAFIVLGSALLSGCSQLRTDNMAKERSGQVSGADTRPVATLKIGSMPTQTASIYAVGRDKGFYKKSGIDVKLTIFNSAMERDAAATANELDGFLTDIMGLVNLRENGFNFFITSSEYENFSILVNPKQKAQNEKDLKGLKVGISNHTVVEFVADKFLAEGYVRKVSIPKVPERLASLMSDNLAAAVFPEPFTSIIKSKGGRVVASSADIGLQPVVFVFSEKAIKERSLDVEKFYKAYNDTVKYMKETPYKEYKDILVSYKIISSDLADTVKLPLNHYTNAAMVTEKDVVAVLDWMKQKNLLKKSLNFSLLVEPRFTKPGAP